MRAKTELAKYCPIIIKKITLIAKTPKKQFFSPLGLLVFLTNSFPNLTIILQTKNPATWRGLMQ